MTVRLAIYNPETGQILRAVECPEAFAVRQAGAGEALMEVPPEVNDVSHYVDGGELAPIPPQPGAAHAFDYATKQWHDPRPLLYLREVAHTAINRWRDAQEAAGTVFAHAGRMWDCNAAAKDKLASTAAMESVPPGFFWTDASEPVNEDVPMDIVSVRALREAHEIAYFQRGLQIHVRQREMKAALDSMDAEQLAAFVPGWGDAP